MMMLSSATMSIQIPLPTVICDVWAPSCSSACKRTPWFVESKKVTINGWPPSWIQIIRAKSWSSSCPHRRNKKKMRWGDNLWPPLQRLAVYHFIGNVVWSLLSVKEGAVVVVNQVSQCLGLSAATSYSQWLNHIVAYNIRSRVIIQQMAPLIIG